jgi:hypothetical protein
MVFGVILGVVWFGLFVIVQVGLFHARPIENRSRAIAIVFVLALGAQILSAGIGIGLMFGVPPLSAFFVTVLSGVLVMAGLFVIYMPLYYTISASLSVQALITIERAGAGGLTLETLAPVSYLEELVRLRLESMAASGNLLHEGEVFRLTPKGRGIAWAFQALKRLWRLGPGG